LTWIGDRGTGYGIAAVYLDGELSSEVDLYRPSSELNVVLFTITDISPAPHLLGIAVTGRKHANAASCRIVNDRFDIRTSGEQQLVILNEWNYSELGWGNYRKPSISITKGYGNEVRIRLTDKDDHKPATVYQ